MKMKLDAAQLLLYRAATNADRGLPSADETAIAKVFCNQAGFDVANEALQVMGGLGYSAGDAGRVLRAPLPRLDDRRRLDRDPEEPHRREHLRAQLLAARGRLAMIHRRTMLAGTAISLFAPFFAFAQQKPKVVRVGLFGNTPGPQWDIFRKTLRDRGWVEGQNLTIDERWMMGNAQRAAEHAASLIALKPDVLVASSSTQVEALRQVTKTIPIIFLLHADPVGVGHVASLARPGGNITGLSQLLTEVSARMFQLLHDAIPKASTIGVLWNPTTPTHKAALGAIEAAALQRRVRAVMVGAGSAEELPPAFVQLTGERVGALLVVPSPLTFRERTRIADLCLTHRLPGMFGFKENVEAGGLLSYGVDIVDQTERVAYYVDRVLRGANPAELPVEQASKFELAINMKTARALNLTLPNTILVAAAHVIE